MKLLIMFIISLSLQAQMTQRIQLIMGTLVTLKVEQEHQQTLEGAFELIRAVDNSLSTFKQNSIISQLNTNKVVLLDALSFEALSLCQDYYEQTDGYFNIAIGHITKDLYQFGAQQHLVNSDILSASNVNFDALHFDAHKASLEEGIKIDLGGMGKGFALDKANEYFKNLGVRKGVLSASGDIRCLDRCSIAIQDPFQDALLFHFTTTKKDLGITTSGNYNRFVKDKKHNHLINPKTKSSQQNFASITLVGSMKSSALDAYATAISVMPKKDAYKFLDALDLAYVVVEVDKKTVVKNASFFELK